MHSHMLLCPAVAHCFETRFPGLRKDKGGGAHEPQLRDERFLGSALRFHLEARCVRRAGWGERDSIDNQVPVELISSWQSFLLPTKPVENLSLERFNPAPQFPAKVLDANTILLNWLGPCMVQGCLELC